MAAAAAITPRVRLMAVCDGVRESKAEDGVFNLKGVRRRIVATSFPYVPARLWLFLQLSSSRQGVFPSYVRIVNDRTDKCVFHAKIDPTPTFEDTDQFWATRDSIRCSFPAAGRYTVQVWFFQEQGTDVLKGEYPLNVVEGA
jgi:hypothetical protein